jgi:hypothetical protein
MKEDGFREYFGLGQRLRCVGLRPTFVPGNPLHIGTHYPVGNARCNFNRDPKGISVVRPPQPICCILLAYLRHTVALLLKNPRFIYRFLTPFPSFSFFLAISLR